VAASAIVEQIPGQFRILYECQRNEAERLHRRLDAFEKTMSEGFEDVRRAARQDSTAAPSLVE
jgi:hypothetical protein